MVEEVPGVQIEMAWRDERVSIFAMSGLGMGICSDPPLFVCKKRSVGHRGPFVLDPCRGRPRFQLSPLGLLLQEAVVRTEYPLRYAARIDSYLRIPVTYEVFAGLCSEGWFALWHPSTFLAYFDGFKEGYLTLLRVARMDEEIPGELLQHGRSGANFIYRLDHPVTVRNVHPVIRSDQFARRKQELKDFLLSHHWLLGEEEPVPTEEELETEDLFAGLGLARGSSR